MLLWRRVWLHSHRIKAKWFLGLCASGVSWCTEVCEDINDNLLVKSGLVFLEQLNTLSQNRSVKMEIYPEGLKAESLKPRCAKYHDPCDNSMGRGGRSFLTFLTTSWLLDLHQQSLMVIERWYHLTCASLVT